MTEQNSPLANTAPATTSPQDRRAVAPVAQLKSGLDQMRSQLLLQLPAHVKVDRFIRICMTAVNNNPDLLGCDRRSFYQACLKAASDGLLPDGREGALVPFKDHSNRKLVQWMPMVSGLIKLIRQSGEIDSIGARIVYQREIDEKRFNFVITEGREQLFHDPILWGERGDPVIAYAYARFKESGHVEYLPMHKADILKRKVMSRAAKGPWQTWELEMWQKTVLRALAKRLPLSSDLVEKIEREEEPSEFDKMRDEAVSTAAAQLGAPTPEPEPEPEIVDAGQQGRAEPPDDEPEVVEAQPSDQTELMVESMVDAACAALEPNAQGESEEGNTRDELDAFVDHIKLNIRSQPIREMLRESLLRRISTASVKRLKTLSKGS